MLFLTNLRATFATIWGIFVWVFASSSVSFERLEKGLSSTIPATVESLELWRMLVTAPIDRPQSPINATLSDYLKKSITVCKSSFSLYPSVTQSPVEYPHPLKSKLNNVTPCGNSMATPGKASNLLEQFPCMYITHDNFSATLSSITGSQWEHCNVLPLGFFNSKSVLWNRRLPSLKCFGPKTGIWS